jgi:hypothetical protein
MLPVGMTTGFLDSYPRVWDMGPLLRKMEGLLVTVLLKGLLFGASYTNECDI